MNFKVGDSVVLKSGSNKMSVHSVDATTSEVVCDWHDKDGKPHREKYHQDQLEMF